MSMDLNKDDPNYWKPNHGVPVKTTAEQCPCKCIFGALLPTVPAPDSQASFAWLESAEAVEKFETKKFLYPYLPQCWVKFKFCPFCGKLLC